jgi:hypothetical protein
MHFFFDELHQEQDAAIRPILVTHSMHVDLCLTQLLHVPSIGPHSMNYWWSVVKLQT